MNLNFGIDDNGNIKKKLVKKIGSLAEEIIIIRKRIVFSNLLSISKNLWRYIPNKRRIKHGAPKKTPT